MELMFIVYLVDKFTGWMEGLGAFLVFVGVTLSVIFALLKLCEDISEETKGKLNLKAPVSIAILGLLLSLAPSKETAYKMLAAYGASELVQMEETKQVGSKAYKAVNKILDDFLEEESNEN